ncbi:MAG: flagellar hook-length control protein FliK [Micrococcus sp.]|nr:flagellar hook-length control protein FliK [Micrococcus sp.]
MRAWTVQQLTTPVVQAAGRATTLPDGTHLATIRISPESLGPVTLEAMARDGVVRLEISAATEAGRENLRAVLGELRRELAATGSGVTLDLAGNRDQSTGREQSGQPGTGAGAGQGAGAGAGDRAGGRTDRVPADVGIGSPEADGPGEGPRTGPGEPGAGLDVYA